MMLSRLPFLGLLAALPLLPACNQTTASPPAVESGVVAADPAVASDSMGSGVRTALADAQATRERQSSQATALGVMSFFDPIGVTDLAEPIMKAQHQRELDEKYRRVDEEVQKTIAEAEEIKARSQASTNAAKPRKRTTAAAE